MKNPKIILSILFAAMAYRLADVYGARLEAVICLIISSIMLYGYFGDRE